MLYIFIKILTKFKLSIKGCFIEAYVHIGIVLGAHESEPLNNMSIFLLLLTKILFILVCFLLVFCNH